MSHPDLTALLRGEPDHAELGRLADHLATCGTCRGELSRLAVGHAVIVSAARMLPPVADPPPPLTAATRSRRSATRPILVAAAVAVVVMVVGGLVTDRTRDVAPTSYAVVPLEAVSGTGTGRAQMSGADGTTSLRISTHGLRQPHDRAFYYAWLLDPATAKMLPLGQVESGGTATFVVASSLVARYSSIDISLERDDGDPAHSATSVLRGRYAGS